MTSKQQQFRDNYAQGAAPASDRAIYDRMIRYWWLLDREARTLAYKATLLAMDPGEFKARYFTPGCITGQDRRLQSIRFQLTGFRAEFAAEGINPDVVPIAPPPFEHTAWGRVAPARAAA
jgi:hypothetical protein